MTMSDSPPAEESRLFVGKVMCCHTFLLDIDLDKCHQYITIKVSDVLSLDDPSIFQFDFCLVGSLSFVLFLSADCAIVRRQDYSVA
jgi:hypothetical protein